MKSLRTIFIFFIAIFVTFASACDEKTKVKTFNSSFIDFRDGRTYNVTQIGDQVWMVENLNVDRFLNGDLIPEARSKSEWEAYGKSREPAWCYYDNDYKNGEKCGKLYNWYAVTDPRGLAPTGWRIPSDQDWTVVTDYLGSKGKPGAELKSMRSQYGWKNDRNGSNESGFSGLPGGLRGDYGEFHSIGAYGFWWSSTEYLSNMSWYRYLYYGFGDGGKKYSFHDSGISVRCIMD